MRITSITLLLSVTGLFAGMEIPFLPQGPNWAVTHLAFHEGRILAAGAFIGADDVRSPGIALWDGAGWNALGEGLRKRGNPASLADLNWDGQRVLACGDFDSAGTASAMGRASWNGNAWTALGSNNGPCDAMVAWKGRILAATRTLEGKQIIEEWNGKAWVEALAAPPGEVRGFAVHEDQLWVSLSLVNSQGTSFLAVWQDTGWTEAFGRLPGTIRNLAWRGGKPYVMNLKGDAGEVMVAENGRWRSVGGEVTVHFASMAIDGNVVYRNRLDTATQLESIDILEGEVFKPMVTVPRWTIGLLHAHRGVLYIRGPFRATISGGADNLVAYDGKAWKGVTRGLRPGPGKGSRVLASDGDKLYAGGEENFIPPGNQLATIGSWDGKTWDPMGNTFPGRLYGPRRGIHAISQLAVSGRDVYVGGSFDSLPDGRPTRNVARWDGQAWHPLGEGFPGVVSAMAVSAGHLYVGSGPTDQKPPIPGHPLQDQKIGRWNGTAWERVGEGLKGSVRKLVGWGNKVVAWGEFEGDPSGDPHQLAIWDGVTWSFHLSAPVGIHDLAVFQGEVYFAGEFEAASTGGNSTWVGLARLNGSSLAYLDSSGGPAGTMLAAGSDYLYYYNGQAVTAWDGKNTWKRWTPDADNIIRAMTVHQGALWCTGRIPSVEGRVAYNFAIWNPTASVGVRPVRADRMAGPLAELRMLRLPGGSLILGVERGTQLLDLKGRLKNPGL